MAARFPRGKQPKFAVHCIGTRTFSNRIKSNNVCLQLAVLGACQCRGASDTDPCGCAYAATNLTREVYRLREEVSVKATRPCFTQVLMTTITVLSADLII